MYETFNHLFYSKPRDLVYPNSLSELSQIVKNSQMKIRISGSNHTFNDMSLTSGLIIRTNNMNKILNVDVQNQTVRVESGTIVDDINTTLAQYELALPIEAAISLQSVGGIISTGTHGSNINSQSFSGNVKALTLVLASGEIKQFDEQDGDYFRAVKCGLGCLGAIYDITFKCEPMYEIEERVITTNWDDFTSSLDRILFQYPLTQVDVDQFSPNLDTTVTLRRKISGQGGYKTLTSNQPPHYYIECEMALPIELIKEALIYTAQLHNKFKARSNSNLFVRFCGADDTLISMESKHKTAFISSFFGHEVDSNTAIQILKTICDELIYHFNARPHYGKIHNLDINKMIQLYGDNYYKFRQIKDKLDPAGKFDNDYIEKLFN
jgi:FAD/FMN-containing dehydrogenase